jgi:hypothetical protein
MGPQKGIYVDNLMGITIIMGSYEGLYIAIIMRFYGRPLLL